MQVIKHIFLLSIIVILHYSLAFSQQNYWQQKADYDIDVKINTENHTFTGNESITYTNNSPDTLKILYMHLFFNAFKPNSKMDIHSRTIKDPDPRVMDRISKLKPEEQGDLTVLKINQTIYHTSTTQQRVIPVKFNSSDTILKLYMPTDILTKETVTLNVEFKGQIPLQVRRSGRDSAEGISYSMTQWYPKIAEYDFTGWHNDYYVGREFHGVWGDYKVRIEINKKFIVAGTGVLQNADEIGYGYTTSSKLVNNNYDKNITWIFTAENVIDFAFAADPDYIHDKYKVPNGPLFHFFYQDGPSAIHWKTLPQKMKKALDYMTKNVGPYPYPQYSFIQGGDGGMEYPMCTLITGNRPEKSLTSVSIHEFVHSWFQFMFATNESLYPWMDEGFTTYYTSQIKRYIYSNNEKPVTNVGFDGYISMVNDNIQEPATTHADHYILNRTYSTTSYLKGAVFIGLVRQIIGEEHFLKGMKRYYHDWAFKHPTPNDFIRCFEKVSNLELSWLIEYLINTTKTIDYAVDNVKGLGVTESEVVLKRIEDVPMPVYVNVKTAKKNHRFYIPIDLTIGNKTINDDTRLMQAWQWVNKEYKFIVDIPSDEIKSISIDPDEYLPDIDRSNNSLEPKK